jgi:hypothetical protein
LLSHYAKLRGRENASKKGFEVATKGWVSTHCSSTSGEIIEPETHPFFAFGNIAEILDEALNFARNVRAGILTFRLLPVTPTANRHDKHRAQWYHPRLGELSVNANCRRNP